MGPTIRQGEACLDRRRLATGNRRARTAKRLPRKRRQSACAGASPFVDRSGAGGFQWCVPASSLPSSWRINIPGPEHTWNTRQTHRPTRAKQGKLLRTSMDEADWQRGLRESYRSSYIAPYSFFHNNTRLEIAARYPCCLRASRLGCGGLHCRCHSGRPHLQRDNKRGCTAICSPPSPHRERGKPLEACSEGGARVPGAIVDWATTASNTVTSDRRCPLQTITCKPRTAGGPAFPKAANTCRYVHTYMPRGRAQSTSQVNDPHSIVRSQRRPATGTGLRALASEALTLR